jgi:hypothetical protein
MAPQEISCALLTRTLEEFLAASRDAVVLENGALIFDLQAARYSLSGDHGKCLLHLWSAERNLVRRVLDAEQKANVLRLSVQRMGQARPSRLEICLRRDARAPAARKAARSAYQQVLERILTRHDPDSRLGRLTSAMDLERSFGPVYARGLTRRGQSAFAVLGVNAQETQTAVDGSLTFGILWLEKCRESHAGKLMVEGLKLFVPAGRSAVVRQRMAYLNSAAAKWQLYELDEREETITEADCRDRGNLDTRLARLSDDSITLERFADAIAQVRAVLPDADIEVLSPGEISFRCRGLEFARARMATESSFRGHPELFCGTGAHETLWTEESAPRLTDAIQRLAAARSSHGRRDHALYRIHPERWLETLVAKDVSVIDSSLAHRPCYAQVPAFSAADRSMVDVLALTRSHRLAVLELKADEDIHLPLQGLDYWSRVAFHHARGEFSRFGYFPGVELSPQPPLLYLVAPALHVHPATDTLLHYLAPEIEWTLAGIGEGWRERVLTVFRKRSSDASSPARLQ